MRIMLTDIPHGPMEDQLEAGAIIRHGCPEMGYDEKRRPSIVVEAYTRPDNFHPRRVTVIRPVTWLEELKLDLGLPVL